MERREIESEPIRSIGYDARAEILEIEFRTGRVYRYEGVPLARVLRDDAVALERPLPDRAHQGRVPFRQVR